MVIEYKISKIVVELYSKSLKAAFLDAGSLNTHDNLFINTMTLPCESYLRYTMKNDGIVQEKTCDSFQ